MAIPAQVFLWSALLALTVAILMYPSNLGLRSFAITSADVFPRLPILGALVYLWAAFLAKVLLTDADERIARWKRLILVGIAALVFRGFWNIIAPEQLEGVVRINTSEVWQAHGRITFGPTVGYMGWPGASLPSIILTESTGLPLLQAVTALTVFTSIVIGLGAYTYMLGILADSFLAAIAALLVVVGNLAMIIYHQAGPTAIVFVVLFMSLLMHPRSCRATSGMLVGLVLLMGASVTHFHSAMHFFFLALGVWILTRSDRESSGSWASALLVAVFFSLPMAWLIFWALSGLASISNWTLTSLLNPALLADRLTSVLVIGQANFGPSVPTWYSFTRFAWLGVLYAAGGVIWIQEMFRFGSLGRTNQRVTAAFFGLGLISLTSSLVSPRGFAELLRALTYIPFFTVPLLALAVRRSGPTFAKRVSLGLLVLFVGLSFPTFLANNFRINSDSYHKIEFSAGEWLRYAYGNGSGLIVFTTASAVGPVQRFLPEASYTTERQTHEFERWTAESLWKALDELLDKFDSAAHRQWKAVYVHSPKEALQRSMTFNIPYSHPNWAAIGDRLSVSHDKVYENGPLQSYIGQGAGK